jgi:hypothetical protein
MVPYDAPRKLGVAGRDEVEQPAQVTVEDQHSNAPHSIALRATRNTFIAAPFLICLKITLDRGSLEFFVMLNLRVRIGASAWRLPGRGVFVSKSVYRRSGLDRLDQSYSRTSLVRMLPIGFFSFSRPRAGRANPARRDTAIVFWNAGFTTDLPSDQGQFLPGYILRLI